MPKQTKAAVKEATTKEVLMLHDALPLRRGGIYTLPADLAQSAIKTKIAASPTEQHRAIAGKVHTTPPASDCLALQELIAARTPEKD